jgi:predicted 2-oxoglutarate/Fe(II)-dependent dioxygenase YbiX
VVPQIEKQYAVSIDNVQMPKFCLYENGDFYGIHVDNSPLEKAAADAKERKVSAIIFLNEESREPEKGKYCGGNLTFYGLNENEAFAKFGLPLVGEQGMLITFPPTLPHEVTKVTAGERFTIATSSL